jgi:chaperone BCS1
VPLLDTIQATLKSNPLLAGGASMALMGWVLVQARALPLLVWRFLQDQFSATLTVYSEDTIFRLLNMWLAKHPSAAKARRLNVAELWNRERDEDDYALTPGTGYHLIREGLRFYLLHRVTEDKSAGESYAPRRKQTLHITTLGRSRAPLTSLLARAKTVQQDTNAVSVFIWTGMGFELVERRPKRTIDSIYIDPAMKADILQDIRTFQATRAKYVHRCIPYRRGFLLEGPHGTGKSSLIFALASEFGLPIYIINIAGVDNDNSLLRAVNSAGRGMVVIEDIDAATPASAARKTKKAKKSKVAAQPGPPSSTPTDGGGGVTLSGLLNATDGIAAKDGRILFMTSNHPETLDPALIRPGRCDRRFHLGHAGAVEASLMIERFFPDQDPAPYIATLAADLPLAPADLQNRLLAMEAEG